MQKKHVKIVLIGFEGIHDVLQGFHTLFAALVNTPINYTEPAANKTTLGVVINGLIEGNMAVPTLNISVALKFLIELGLYKLHNDYLFLIRNMEPNGEGHFKEEWEYVQHSCFIFILINLILLLIGK